MVDTERVTLLRYDVFTDEPYAGNPLAVAIDPPELVDAQMQRIAGEMNLSETVFLRPRSDGSWSARIFTPATEVPFAVRVGGRAVHVGACELVVPPR